MFTCHVCDVRETDKTSLIHVNISFIASKKPLNTNENSLKMSLSAVKFCSKLRRLLQSIVVAQTIGLEIWLKNRS